MTSAPRKREHASESYRLKRSSREYPATKRIKLDDSKSYFLTAGVRRHPRYLSTLPENIITYDASHHSAMGSKLRSINLADIRIACDGGESVHTGVLPLLYFPNLVDALKLAINSALESAHAGDAQAAVSNCLRHSLRCFSWLMQQGIYQLADVTPRLLNQLIDELAVKGWAQVLQLDFRLLPILERARRDIVFAKRVGGSKSKGSSFGINIAAIEYEIGTPLNPNDIRQEFRELLSRAAGNKKKITSQYKPFELGAGGQLTCTMQTLNFLALHPADHDSIPFFPFHNLQKSTRQACAAARVKQQPSVTTTTDISRHAEEQPKTSGTPTQTPNLGVDAYFSLFSNALKWLYDYGPAIAELTEYARDAVMRGGPKTSNQDVRRKIVEKYKELAENNSLPAECIDSVNMSNSSWLGLVKTLLFALFALIGMNHGRRPNEIGGRKPYGMYYGCLKQISVEPNEYQAEFYVEKGPQDYRWFPANVLVADAVALLERLHLAMRHLDAPGGASGTGDAVDRTKHLFRFRLMTWAGLNKEPSVPSFDIVKRTFFDLSGVPYTEFEGRQIPFRRAFATLYVRRYDHPDGAALQDQLGHLDFSATVGYFTDLKHREPGKTILELHSKDAVNVGGMLDELHSVSVEFLADLIVRMLKGEAMGGLFPYLVAKLIKRLSANVDFSSLTMTRRARTTAEILASRGYLPHSMPHNNCMVGSARHTRRSAKCFKEGSLRKERASPTTCEGCVNSLTTAGNQQIVKQQTSALQAQTRDSRCPRVVKLAALREEKVQLDYLERDLERAQSNSIMLKSLLEKWPETIGAALHGK